MAKVSRGRQGYYLATVASGREHDGGLIEADGTWLGTGAALLRLGGKVAAPDLDAVLGGRHPVTGELMSPHHGQVKVAGIDCTFSAPKSVSLLHALGPADAVDEMALAHECAVGHTLRYLEEQGGRVRRAHAGRPSIEVEGLTAAAFVHRTSRAPDPHLHTHVIVANCGRGTDGRWSALDGRALFAQCGTASLLYEAQLRREVGMRLGIRFHPDGRRYDIEGFDRTLMRAFSQRSAEIEQHLADKGFAGPRARRIAALVTRPAKDLSVPYEELVAGWRERSISLGIPVGHLGRIVDTGRDRLDRLDRLDRNRSAHPAEQSLDRLAAEILGPRGVTATRSSFSRDELVKAFCRNLPGGASVQEIDTVVRRLADSGAIVGRPNSVRWLQGHDGRWFPAGIDRERFTTPEILALEERIAGIARNGKSSAAIAVADSTLIAEALGARPALPEQEQQTVAEIARSERAVEVLTTVSRPDSAGTLLRSDVLDAARAAWTESSVRVVGVAPNRRAAERFEATTGIESIPASVVPWGSGQVGDAVAARNHSGNATVIVVAGADQLGARRLAELCETTERTRAKVLLVPDHQLDRADSRALQLIAAEGLAIRLDTSRSAQWLHDQELGRLDTPQPTEWSKFGHVAVGLAVTAADARSIAVRAYSERLAAGEDTYLVCPEHAVARCIEADLSARLGDNGQLNSVARTVAPRDLPDLLDSRRRASLVVLGGASALPSSVRRRSTVERTHIVVDRGRDPITRREQALEAAWSPAILRAVGSPGRDLEGRAAWRAGAREHLEGRHLSFARGPIGRDLGR
jgi:conjugative relaxase-like TrwC/TraI family protein